MIELEKKAQEALQEKKRLELKFQQDEKQRLEKERLEAEERAKGIVRGEADMGTYQVGQCEVAQCKEDVYAKLPYCPLHCTPQNVLHFINDPVKAAKVIAEAQEELKRREEVKAAKLLRKQSSKKLSRRRSSVKNMKKLGKSVRRSMHKIQYG